MHLLRLIDSRTVILCKCLIAVILTIVFLALRKLYPALRGVGSIAFGFFLGIPSMLLLSGRGVIPNVFSIVVANLLGALCYVFLYRGVLRFCQGQGSMIWLYGATAVAAVILVYDGLIVDQIVPRIVVMALIIALGRGLTARQVFSHASGRLNMRLFGASLTLTSLVALTRAVVTLLHGAPNDFMQPDSVQSFGQLFGLLTICLDGLFYFAMLVGAINENVQDQAQLDFLTGALNRRGIEEALSAEIARTRRTERPVAVLLIDLDKFKTLNDVLGHIAGDEALRVVARSIASVLRPYDRLGRFGGDEFLLILPEATSHHALNVAHRIREALQSLARVNCRPSPVLTVSIGVSHCETDEENIDILARADAALYEAKTAGRDRARAMLPNQEEVIMPRAVIPRASLLSRVTPRRRPSGLFY